MVVDILRESLVLLAQAAPYILFGLLIAGVLHVLLPENLVLRWMGRPGLGGVVRAAAIGVPLPVCSCGVVPIAVELRRKGASTPASQSFLITTPESSLDSIILTWGLMGPVMAIARPLAAFGTAVLGGVLTILGARSLEELQAEKVCPSCSGAIPEVGSEKDAAHEHEHAHSHGHESHSHDPDSHSHDHAGHHHHHHHHHGHDHDHDHSHDLLYDGGERARAALSTWFSSLGRFGSKKKVDGEESVPTQSPWRGLYEEVLKPSFRYGFGELLDDLAFWLAAGILVAGVLTSLLPQDLSALGLGSGFVPLLLALVISAPIYMCASASTPIAAAFLAKGISPGAALVFLLAGPATNVATVILLLGTFGRRFVRTYLISVVVGALAAGWLLDLFVSRGAWQIAPVDASGEDLGLVSMLSAGALILILGRSLYQGAWNQGWYEFTDSTKRMFGLLSPRLAFRMTPARGALLAVALLLGVWGAAGLRIVPPDSQGFGLIFGRLTQVGANPGLRFHPAPPIGQWELRKVRYPRKADIGYRTDLRVLADRDLLSRRGDPNEWHSPLAAMNSRPDQATFFTADETFVEMNFTVHYGLDDARPFFFDLAHDRDLVALYGESVARNLVASTPLDDLLTKERLTVEERITSELQVALTKIGSGIKIDRVHIVDVHPPEGAVTAFRDVSTALEDRATRIHEAHQMEATSVPLARGESVKLLAEAAADASDRQLVAESDRNTFLPLAASVRRAPSVLRFELRATAAEEALSGRSKIILAPGTAPPRVTFWDAPSPTPRSARESTPNGNGEQP
ncbi:MAG: SO_0444 family Cu/Zn efflux transporter [Acidobacteriota bacterium]